VSAWYNLSPPPGKTRSYSKVLSTVLITDDTSNAQHPPEWFARSEPFACFGPAPFFSQEVTFPSGDIMVNPYGVVIADGDSDQERLVNVDNLEILVIMQNSGLPEAGDARRDAAMAGYQHLKEASLAGRGDAVAQFQRDAVRLVSGRVPAWRDLWRGTIAPEAARTEKWLDELEQGRCSHFADAAVARSSAGGAQQVLGMCGRLRKWDTGHPA
jgi:hypothetical protein